MTAPARTVPPVLTALVTDAVPLARQAPRGTPLPSGVPGGCAGDQAGIWSQSMAACNRAQWLINQSQELVAQARVLIQANADRRRAWLHGQPSQRQRDLWQRSAYLRLLARLDTMPVIEQAKGIIMTHQGCGPEDAFDLLRRASQRSNVPVRELAAQLVANTMQASQATRKAG